jgi:hypothetical protein
MPEAGSQEEETFFMLDVIITVCLTAAQRLLWDVRLSVRTR